MSFMEAVKTCLSKYVTFSGRASRSEFWWFYLFTVIVSVVANIVGGIIGTSIPSMIANLVFILPTISAGVRRMHDTNRSGWWILVPFYNIYLWIQKSDEGENRFG